MLSYLVARTEDDEAGSVESCDALSCVESEEGAGPARSYAASDDDAQPAGFGPWRPQRFVDRISTPALTLTS